MSWMRKSLDKRARSASSTSLKITVTVLLVVSTPGRAMMLAEAI